MGLLRPFCIADGAPRAYVISFAYDQDADKYGRVTPDYVVLAENQGSDTLVSWKVIKVLPLESNDWITEAAYRDPSTSFSCRAVSSSSPTNPSGFVFTLNVRAGREGEGPGFMVQISRLGDDMTGAALVVRNEAAPEGAPARKDDHFNLMAHLYRYPGMGSTEATVPWVDIRADGKRIDFFTSHGLSFPYFPQWSMQMNETVWAITTNSTHLFIMSDASPCHRISAVPLILQTETNSTKVFVQGVEPSRAISRELAAAECRTRFPSSPITASMVVGSGKLSALLIREDKYYTPKSIINNQAQWIADFDLYQYNLTGNNDTSAPLRYEIPLYANENRILLWGERSLPLIPLHDPHQDGYQNPPWMYYQPWFMFGTTDQIGVLTHNGELGDTNLFFEQRDISVEEPFKYYPARDQGTYSRLEIGLTVSGLIILVCIVVGMWFPCRRWYLRRKKARKVKRRERAKLEHKDVYLVAQESRTRRWLRKRIFNGGGGVDGNSEASEDDEGDSSSLGQRNIGQSSAIDLGAVEVRASSPADPDAELATSSSGSRVIKSVASSGGGLEGVRFSKHPRPKVAFVMGEEEAD